MDCLRKERYDYFLIWGNGMPYKGEILDIIRSKDFLKILRITDYRPKSIAGFVRKVYSYDYAPFQHLKAKTRYLLKTEPNVSLILVRNQSPREVYRGQGAFRHIECERIKDIKEQIRNRFNPRTNGNRREEHVVHASDNESQVDHMLKLLGLDQGISALRSVANPILDAPYYLRGFDKFRVREAEASEIYCNVLQGTKEAYRIESAPIEETPHFTCLMGNPIPYQEYLDRFCGGPLTADYSLDRFLALAQNLKYLEYPYATSYILVRELRPNHYLVRDGVHRACILKARGVDRFAVAVMQ